MKRLYFIVLLLAVAQFAHAQTWTLDSFYRPGAIWTEYEYVVHSSSSTNAYFASSGIQYRIDSISQLNNFSYLFVSKRYHGYVDLKTWNYDVTNNPWVNLGRIRIDNEKVYFTRDSGISFCTGCYYKIGEEKLVYDFGISPGDTLKNTYNSLILLSIDSTQLNTGQYVKRFNFDNGQSWLYGIGGEFFVGHNVLLYGGPSYVMSSQALCYENDAILYKYDIKSYSGLTWQLANNCFDVSVLGVNDVKNNEELGLYPNPLFSDDLHISGNQKEYIKRVTVTDAVGRIQYTFTKGDLKGSNRLHIPLAKGIYIVTLELTDSTLITEKIIKN